MKKIAVLDSLVEARALEAALREQGIPHLLKSYHDSAYDGLFQGAMGWGHVAAPEEHASAILALLASLRKGVAEG
jgi:hypothetical protein